MTGNIGVITRSIGIKVNAKYGFLGTNNTFATPAAARRFLRDVGYGSTNKYNSYRQDIILEMLQSDRPVFIGAISGLVDGHAWVIDGLLKRKRTIQYLNLENGRISTVVDYGPLMLHCNWGWGGKCDGYYLAGIFDLTKGPKETDPGLGDINGTNDLDFDWWFRIVTYAKP